MHSIGTKIQRNFGNEMHTRIVKSYDTDQKYYWIEYDNGDSEELKHKKVQKYKCDDLNKTEAHRQEEFDPGGSEEEFDPEGRFIKEGTITDEMKQFLKELTVADIRDFLSDESSNESPFSKEDRVPPPQYHLESSRGEVKDRLTSHTLESYFGGRTLKDFKLLSQLGDGLTVIDAVSDVPSIRKLVNCKQGKRKKKGG